MRREEQIERDLLAKFQDLKYLYRDDIRDRDTLEANFRAKFEEHNRVQLTDGEFKRLLEQIINPDVFGAAKTLRAINAFKRDDDTPLNYTLVNTADWCKNSFEVVNQLRINTDNSHHRYDVIILINGLPVVQIELKSFATSPRKAMQQIVDYKNAHGSGYTRTLLCFMQLFIVSNSNDTWYFANNNNKHFRFDYEERFLPFYRYADEDNTKMPQLDAFAEKFLAKCTLGQMISRYMVLVESERRLLMMRPYQIYAVKAIVDCIRENCGNGYIWHTTGSGKTLTSFKASTLLKDNPDIEKCLFVVDRKDLDRQTREEFNRFQEGSVEENTNTRALVDHLVSDDYADKVIVTTIQKLGLALGGARKGEHGKRLKPLREKLKPLRDKRMVFIFDECHRSQFGENHNAIREFFPRAQFFGFTGTPIFPDNSAYKKRDGTEGSYMTTTDIFQKELHKYTITHAIEDRNVLRFHVDYYKPEGKEKSPEAAHPTGGAAAMPATPATGGETLTKWAVVKAILQKHDAATRDRTFNAILATARINDAIEYYSLFKELQAARANEEGAFKALNVACVFSPPAEGNRDIAQIQEDLPQEKLDNAQEPHKKKQALKAIIADYNARYSANHSIDEFDRYYQDVQKRIKDQQYRHSDVAQGDRIDASGAIDIIIVVDMLLTGFDSTFLNTLYVDKNLKHHGLIQAFSRTNRILNATKPHGTILDFRQQQAAVDAAVTLFSGGAGERAKTIWLVEEAPEMIDKFDNAVQKLATFMHSQGVACAPEEVPNLKGDGARVHFVNLFKDVQRPKVALEQYTDLTAEDKEIVDQILPEEHFRGFKGAYLTTRHQMQAEIIKERGGVAPDARETDFELVLFSSALIDYDYIMGLIAKCTQSAPEKWEVNLNQLIALIESDAKFIDEREDIIEYARQLPRGEGLSEEEIKEGYEAFKQKKHDQRMAEIADHHTLDARALREFVQQIVERLVFDDQDLTELLAPLNLHWKERQTKKRALMHELIPLLTTLARGREIAGLDVYE